MSVNFCQSNDEIIFDKIFGLTKQREKQIPVIPMVEHLKRHKDKLCLISPNKMALLCAIPLLRTRPDIVNHDMRMTRLKCSHPKKPRNRSRGEKRGVIGTCERPS